MSFSWRFLYQTRLHQSILSKCLLNFSMNKWWSFFVWIQVSRLLDHDWVFLFNLLDQICKLKVELQFWMQKHVRLSSVELLEMNPFQFQSNLCLWVIFIIIDSLLSLFSCASLLFLHMKRIKFLKINAFNLWILFLFSFSFFAFLSFFSIMFTNFHIFKMKWQDQDKVEKC